MTAEGCETIDAMDETTTTTDRARVTESPITDIELQAKLSAIVEAHVEVEQARAALTAAQEHLVAARDATHQRLAELAQTYAATGERPLSEVELRELYWRWPEVNVAAIGATMGVQTHDVHRVIGGTVPVRCVDCRQNFDVRPGSRATPVAATGVCPACTALREGRRRAEHAATVARRAEYAAAVAAGGYWIDDLGEVVWHRDSPWYEGTFLAGRYDRHCGCGAGRIAPLNFDEAWEHGGELRFRCNWCDDGTVVDLITWIPPSEPDR